MQEIENSITTLLNQMAQFDQAAKNTGVEVMSAEEMLKEYLRSYHSGIQRNLERS